jgi:hypothetical protein
MMASKPSPFKKLLESDCFHAVPFVSSMHNAKNTP